MDNETFLFDHEKLKVYQQSVSFVGWVEEVLKQCPDKAAVKDQLDRASTSIVLNLAEGNGKFSDKDRCRYFDIARGSVVECAACLDVLVAKNRISPEIALVGKKKLQELVAMLVGLIKSVSNRFKEEPSFYEPERIEQEQEFRAN